MMTYALKKLLGSLPTLFVLAALTFFLIRLAPGSPFDTDRAWPPEIQENINRIYELNQPVAIQFAHWLRDALHGNLRESFQYVGRPVTEMIAESLPASLLLGFLSLLVSIGVGIPLGCLAALKRGSILDFSSMFIAVTGISLPGYLIASLLILLFSGWLHWLPPALWEGPESIVLPLLTLSSRPLAIIARLTRSSLLEALNQDYVRTALSKGVTPSSVVFKHALKNSLLPVLTILGPLGANLVTGSFLVEIVFQIPGLGRHFVQAVLNRDYPLVMGVTLVYGVLLILSNLMVDLLYGWVDPRIRLK